MARRDVSGAWALSALAGVVFFRVQDESAASGQLWIARANVLTAVVVVTDDEHLLQHAHHSCAKCTKPCNRAAPHLKVAEFNQMLALS